MRVIYAYGEDKDKDNMTDWPLYLKHALGNTESTCRPSRALF